MLIQFHEQTVESFLIPSFTLSKSELAIIHLPNGPLFRPLELALIDIITGKAVNNKVNITAKLKYVDYYKESWFRHHFFPVTIRTYLAKYANKANPIYCQKIYDIEWITPKTKVQALAWTPKRLLSLYTTLSWTSDIIFDLVGIDPQRGQEIYNFVKTIVQSGGSAILFDYSDEFKNDCTTFVQANYLG